MASELPLHGVEVSSSLAPLADLLWEWVALVERTARVWTEPEDAVWLYNERASLSIFAGAVWRMGGLAFEEFAIEKTAGLQTSRGRHDLYFELSREHRYQVEGKQAFVSLNGRSSPIARVQSRLDLAVRDVHLCENYECPRLGLVFAAPAFSGSITDFRTAIEQWLRELRSLSPDALAWSFPPEGASKRWKDRIYPGVAVVLRIAHDPPPNPSLQRTSPGRSPGFGR